MAKKQTNKPEPNKVAKLRSQRDALLKEIPEDIEDIVNKAKGIRHKREHITALNKDILDEEDKRLKTTLDAAIEMGKV